MHTKTASRSLPRPGMVHGQYPQRLQAAEPWWLVLADAAGNLLSTRALQRSRDRTPFTDRVAQACEAARNDPADIDTKAHRAAARLRREGFSAAAVSEAQAVIVQVIESVLGYRPYPMQLSAAYELLQDRVVEMATGEGKSLAILIAAVTAAMARVPVHVVTVNEYLAQRDANMAQSVLSRLGFEAGAIHREMKPEERRPIYAKDVVYATSHELGFDYLRDRMLDWAEAKGTAAGPTTLRGLCLALVDEVDSILLDHARTPLILAAPSSRSTPKPVLQAVVAFARELRAGFDYEVDKTLRQAQPHPRSVERLHELLADHEFGPQDTREVAALLTEALIGLHVLRKDVHYVVRDGEVVLIDETTGRAMIDSVWSNGLHALVCTKEGLDPPPQTHVCGQITLQTFLGRYCKIGGISGTLHEARWQLWFLYGLGVRRIAPRMRSKGRHIGLRLAIDKPRQFQLVTQSIEAQTSAGRAVLVGTDSIAAADALSQHLEAVGVPHALLTARDDAVEAVMVERAGASGAVTVTTNMAGRGTHIDLDERALAGGGLHVIGCTQNGSPRIDRQLFGRAARGGQPGSFESILCLDDDAFAAHLPRWARRWLGSLSSAQGTLRPSIGRFVARCVQWLCVWNEFYRSWQLLRLARSHRDVLLRLPNRE